MSVITSVPKDTLRIVLKEGTTSASINTSCISPSASSSLQQSDNGISYYDITDGDSYNFSSKTRGYVVNDSNVIGIACGAGTATSIHGTESNNWSSSFKSTNSPIYFYIAGTSVLINEIQNIVDDSFNKVTICFPTANKTQILNTNTSEANIKKYFKDVKWV